jgi:hypothetical protein
VILPDEINKSILKDYETYLYGFKERVVEKYNPAGNKENSLPVLGLSAVEKRWDLINQSINSARSLSKEDTVELNKDSLSYSDEELNEWKKTFKGSYETLRAKGLGELNAKDLKKVCFEKERFKRITIGDAQKSTELLEILQGQAVEPRKKFIYENANNLGFNFD